MTNNNQPYAEPQQPCSDKLAFDSRRQAEAEALATKWRRGTELKVYHCRHCGLWHLSSSND